MVALCTSVSLVTPRWSQTPALTHGVTKLSNLDFELHLTSLCTQVSEKKNPKNCKGFFTADVAPKIHVILKQTTAKVGSAASSNFGDKPTLFTCTPKFFIIKYYFLKKTLPNPKTIWTHGTKWKMPSNFFNQKKENSLVLEHLVRNRHSNISLFQIWKWLQQQF